MDLPKKIFWDHKEVQIHRAVENYHEEETLGLSSSPLILFFTK